ncbi:MAG: hypothetical protein C5B52_01040 [Bacteroidetes bacterium]|nr:MAG: hypothetical protein C5B52_01040 [Bacteroidota bacterium]
MKTIIIFSIFIFLFGCTGAGNHEGHDNMSNVPKSKSDSLYKEVMNGHNEAMAKFGELERYQTLLKKQKDSVSAIKNKSAVNSSIQNTLDSALLELQNAESAMNAWMDGFDPDKAGKTEEEKINYYNNEKEKVSKVQGQINQSLAKAKELSRK